MPGFAYCTSASPHRDFFAPLVASPSSPRPVSLLSDALLDLGRVVYGDRERGKEGASLGQEGGEGVDSF